MSDLNSCPFCGKPGDIYHGAFGWCEACGARGPRADSAKEAESLWNSRPSPWIAVGERVPEHEIEVVVYDGMGVFCADRWRDEWIRGDDLVEGITHWMPLPAPPQEAP